MDVSFTTALAYYVAREILIGGCGSDAQYSASGSAFDDQVLGDCATSATSAAQPNQSPSNPERIDRSEHRNLFVALHMERARTHA
jgi:hypothetical protein